MCGQILNDGARAVALAFSRDGPGDRSREASGRREEQTRERVEVKTGHGCVEPYRDLARNETGDRSPLHEPIAASRLGQREFKPAITEQGRKRSILDRYGSEGRGVGRHAKVDIGKRGAV